MSKIILHALCGLSCLACAESELTLNLSLYNEAINEIRRDSFEGELKPVAEPDAIKSIILPDISSSFNAGSIKISSLGLLGEVALWHELIECMRDNSTGNLVQAAQARIGIVTLFRSLNKGIDDASLGLVLKLHDDYLLGTKVARLEMGLALLQGEHKQISWPQSRELSMTILDSLKKDLKKSR